jgi:hypothetical protein
MSDTRGIGDNSPKPLTPEQVSAWLADTCSDLTKRQKEILAGIERFLKAYPVIPDEEVQAKASDFAGQRGAISSFITASDARHKTEKQPFLDGGRAVDGFFKTLTVKVAEGRESIRERMTAFAVKLEEQRREAARKEAEAAAERARLAAEEAAKTMTDEKLDAAADLAAQADRAEAKAEAKPAELSRTYGAMGGISSLRTTWSFDEAKSDLLELAKAVIQGRAPISFLAFNSVRIGQAIRSEKLRECPGLVIVETKSV